MPALNLTPGSGSAQPWFKVKLASRPAQPGSLFVTHLVAAALLLGAMRLAGGAQARAHCTVLPSLGPCPVPDFPQMIIVTLGINTVSKHQSVTFLLKFNLQPFWASLLVSTDCN